ncbi:putative bacteriocin secretion accessory protein [Streptococcus criceti]|uniref:LcnD-like C-terminal domain-containing protein n=1 Tax=Streptococcus criceti HS-6 TaxID=873449 RepID=G5JN08_STRCG|nr:hypothetical protein STRCR_1340 [Streptococcus criceti HS-6]SUN38875.1 putative bacteriocin secretion accessory protein [Streptococcus criceti]
MVSHIDKTATTTKQGNVFKITAKIKLKKQDKSSLKYGLQGKVTSIVAKKVILITTKKRYSQPLTKLACENSQV